MLFVLEVVVNKLICNIVFYKKLMKLKRKKFKGKKINLNYRKKYNWKNNKEKKNIKKNIKNIQNM